MALFTIYCASAGSGKTHLLVSEYLLIALRSPTKFQEILATTFTNEATREMKCRVIDVLYQLSQGIPNSYIERFSKKFSSHEDVKNRASAALKNLLHNYSRFNIETLDSFFQRVIRSFVKDIGLQSGFAIEVNEANVLQNVVQRVIRKSVQDKTLSAWLELFVEEKLKSGYHWHLEEELIRLGKELLRESLHLKGFHKEGHSFNIEKIAIVENQCKQIITTFEHDMKLLGKQACSIIHSAGLSIDDFSYGKSGVAGYFRMLVEKKNFQPTKRAIVALDLGKGWAPQNSKKKEAIQQLVNTKLENCLRKCVSYYNENCLSYITAMASQKWIYALGVLNRLYLELNKYREEEGMMLISDTTHFLNDLMDNNETPFIYEKMGSYYQHFFIDEFQDVSNFQWHNIKPLIENGLSGGYKSLIVGDVKQSIYRWRGGEPRLLLGKVAQAFSQYQPEVKSLVYNWRSCPNIISFNNYFFSQAVDIIESEQAMESEVMDSNPNIKPSLIYQAYLNHQQKQPVSDNKHLFKGYWEVVSYEKKNQKKDLQPSYDFIIEKIENLQAKGYQLNEIAILVRNNQEVKNILSFLYEYSQSGQADKNCNYQAVGNTSLLLSESAWVLLLVAMLKYLLDPEDRVNNFTLAYYYQQLIKNEDIAFCQNIFTVSSDEILHYLPNFLVIKHEGLLRIPPLEVISLFIAHLSVNADANLYWETFKTLIHQLQQQKPQTIASILEWWESEGVKETVILPYASQEAIRVMTIHQSKGLEFKAVVVPNCSWELDHPTRRGPMLWVTPKYSPFSDLPFIPIAYDQQLLDTHYHLDYIKEQEKTYLDHLNLLYVALTRSIECLYILSYHSQGKNLKTVGDLMFKVVSRLMQNPSLDNISINSGAGKVQIFGGEMLINKSQLFRQEKIDLDIKTHQGKERSLGEVLMKDEIKQSIIYGEKIHRILADIETKFNFESVLSTYCEEGEVNQEEKKVIKNTLERIFSHPKAGEWFKKGWRIMNEEAVLVPGGSIRRPDRVIIKGQKAIIIDFKTGHLQMKYQNQVKAYASLLHQMGYKKLESYLLYIPSVEVIQVI